MQDFHSGFYYYKANWLILSCSMWSANIVVIIICTGLIPYREYFDFPILLLLSSSSWNCNTPPEYFWDYYYHSVGSRFATRRRHRQCCCVYVNECLIQVELNCWMCLATIKKIEKKKKIVPWPYLSDLERSEADEDDNERNTTFTIVQPTLLYYVLY